MAAPLADADWFNLLSQAEEEALQERDSTPPPSEAPADLVSRRPLEWERVRVASTEVA